VFTIWFIIDIKKITWIEIMLLILSSEMLVIHLMQIIKRHDLTLKLWTLLILMKCRFDLLLEPLNLLLLVFCKIWRLHISTIFLIDNLKLFLLLKLLMHLFHLFSSFVIFVLLVDNLLLLVQDSFHFNLLHFLFYVREILFWGIAVFCVLGHIFY
jgi:hypothetical protein